MSSRKITPLSISIASLLFIWNKWIIKQALTPGGAGAGSIPMQRTVPLDSTVLGMGREFSEGGREGGPYKCTLSEKCKHLIHNSLHISLVLHINRIYDKTCQQGHNKRVGRTLCVNNPHEINKYERNVRHLKQNLRESLHAAKNFTIMLLKVCFVKSLTNARPNLRQENAPQM